MRKKYTIGIAVAGGIVALGALVFFISSRTAREEKDMARGPMPAPDEVPLIEGKIVMQNFAFRPLRYRMIKGDKVTWKNLDTVAHTVTAPVLGGQHVLEPGAEFTFATDELPFTGEITYQCDFHPRMTGILAVIPAEPTSQFGTFYTGLTPVGQACVAEALGARLKGFLDGTILTMTQEELGALESCTK